MQKNTIQDLRFSSGMTQKQFAEALGVTRSYLAQLECGMRAPSAKLARKLETFERAFTHTGDHSVHIQQNPMGDLKIDTQTINAGANVRVGAPAPVPPAPATESVLIEALRHQIATLEATVAAQQKVIDSLTALLKPPSPQP